MGRVHYRLLLALQTEHLVLFLRQHSLRDLPGLSHHTSPVACKCLSKLGGLQGPPTFDTAPKAAHGPTWPLEQEPTRDRYPALGCSLLQKQHLYGAATEEGRVSGLLVSSLLPSLTFICYFSTGIPGISPAHLLVNAAEPLSRMVNSAGPSSSPALDSSLSS